MGGDDSKKIRYRREVALDSHLIHEIYDVIHAFVKRYPEYREEISNTSPYYSGHEWSDDREESFLTEIKDVSKTVFTYATWRKGTDSTQEIQWEKQGFWFEILDRSDPTVVDLFETLRKHCETKEG